MSAPQGLEIGNITFNVRGFSGDVINRPGYVRAVSNHANLKDITSERSPI